MRFITTDSTFFKQGTAKAYVVYDGRHHYYIPKSQVKVIETIPPASEYDIEHHVLEISDWILRKNNIPIFRLCELELVR